MAHRRRTDGTARNSEARGERSLARHIWNDPPWPPFLKGVPVARTRSDHAKLLLASGRKIDGRR